jgi:mRNA interferase RelE/StbE
MTYRIDITPAAARQLERLPRDLRRRVDTRILALAHDPRPAGVRQLDRGLYRVRVGSYRVAYGVHDERIIVFVLAIGHRKEIYRFMRRIGLL